MEQEAWTRPPRDARRGRGSLSNASGRFEAERRELADDGWGVWEEVSPIRTTLTEDTSRTVIARNSSPDVPFDRSVNPYRGCEHGCIYCFARPTHAYLGLSPGLDFETRLFFKPDVAALLQKELAKRSYDCDVLAMGTNTDPYQPVEREKGLTRAVLQVLAEHDHPVSIVTKSDLVTRDIDILAPMAAKGLAHVCLSVTTLDHRLARKMEPRAVTPSKRLAAIGELARAHIPTGVLFAPVIPALNDSEMEAVLEEAAAMGARDAGYVLLRLPLEIAGLFREWLAENAPNRAARVMKLLREMRGGEDYQSAFGSRMRGQGPYADLLARRFRLASGRLGLNKRGFRLDRDKFRRPVLPGGQFDLFGG